jgi:hypothetical protein
MAFIDELGKFASPALVAPNWTVRLDTHFLGGRRHFYSWEVADIGLIVYVRLGGRVRARKVALLQSKRLFPSSGGAVAVDELDEYQIGFGRLLPSQELTVELAKRTTYRFTPASKYKSLLTADHQSVAIAEFETARQVPVHYLFYNPWDVPSSTTTPLSAVPKLHGAGSGGARVVPAALVAQKLAGKVPSHAPSFAELAGLVGIGSHLAGWRLDHFVADLVLGCKQGKLIEPNDHATMRGLFSERSGPISAAIAVAIEGPAQ